jgi:hypothetical protein
MRRLPITALAVVGTIVLLGLGARLVISWIAGSGFGIVEGSNRKPLAHVPVFLDRGGSAIERYVTDNAGAFTFPLEPREIQHAVWLICAPGTIPMVGSREPDQAGPTTYGVTPMADSTWGSYRASGWRGPIPRECPTGTDTIGWRYPPSAGKGKGAFTTIEPEWPR